MARRSAPPDSDSIHYEVRCPTCNVSFAVGTRKCLHCGGRTAAAGLGPAPSLRQNLLEHEMGPSSEFDPVALEKELAEADPERSRFPFRLGMSSIWILLAVIGSAYRVCAGG